MDELTADERAQFEAWATEQGWSVDRAQGPSGKRYYTIAHVQIAERTWQAARLPLLAQRDRLLGYVKTQVARCPACMDRPSGTPCEVCKPMRAAIAEVEKRDE